MAKHKYSMGSMPAASAGKLGLAVTMGQIYIRHAEENAKVALYDMWGVGACIAAELSVGSLWQSENDFVSEVSRSCAFSGTVSITEGPSVRLIGGYTTCQYCTWLSGQDPLAAGTLCAGGGLTFGVAAGVTIVSGQFCRLNYIGYRILPWLVQPDKGDKF